MSRNSTSKGTSRQSSRKAEADKRKRRNIVLASVAGLALVGAAAVAWPEGDGSAGGSGPDAFAHVHGLGVDPSDGMLYAGTHYGTFRVPAGEDPVQVGPIRDYMGFTVVGPNHFLASGHPGIGENAPGNLGLIESTNGGEKWDTLSLRGQADFHALASRKGVTYGNSAGVLMASQDNKTWERRSNLPMRDIAISPTDTNRLLATTSSGLARSTDGGRNFQLISPAPPLSLISIADNGRAVGVTDDGIVHVSADEGTTWEQRGSINGAPQAMTATNDSIHIATADGILDSTDGGQTFTTRYSTSA